MAEKSSIFDMIGPVMIGPSSSHTAGAVRIGRVAHHLLGSLPQRLEITFYNSFATTFEGHGSDRAVIAGCMDYKTDDARIKTALDIAAENGIDYQFKPVGNASTFHPNTIRVRATAGDKTVEVLGESLGGGVINIAEINGFPCNLSAGLHTLVVVAEDVRGTIAFIANILSNDNCNIATMSCSRLGKNQLASHFYEIDSPMRPLTLEYLRSLPWVQQVTYFEPLL